MVPVQASISYPLCQFLKGDLPQPQHTSTFARISSNPNQQIRSKSFQELTGCCSLPLPSLLSRPPTVLPPPPSPKWAYAPPLPCNQRCTACRGLIGLSEQMLKMSGLGGLNLGPIRWHAKSNGKPVPPVETPLPLQQVWHRHRCVYGTQMSLKLLLAYHVSLTYCECATPLQHG